MQQPRPTRPVARRAAERRRPGRRLDHAPAEAADPLDPAAPPEVSSLSWSFPGTPADVSCSRRWLASAATELWGEGEDTDRLVLAYSEVATNAVVHGTGPVSVAAQIGPTGARCEIADRSTRLPQARHPAMDDVGGRGLELVRALADGVRVAPDEDGKTVSFVVGRHSDSTDSTDSTGRRADR